MYRIAVGSQQGHKVFTLQTIPSWEDDFDNNQVGKIAGFSLHAGVATKTRERKKLERLCRYIARPAVSVKRLALTSHGKVRYELKTPYRDGATGRRSDTLYLTPWTLLPNWLHWHPDPTPI